MNTSVKKEVRILTEEKMNKILDLAKRLRGNLHLPTIHSYLEQVYYEGYLDGLEMGRKILREEER